MKKTLLALTMTIFALTSFAQSTSFDGIKKIKLRNSGEIIRQETVVGYYFFYQYDKLDKNSFEYHLEILDENLGKVASKVITGSRTLYLLESAFNGEELYFKFYETKENKLTIEKYDTKAELINKTTTTLENKEERYLLATYFSGDNEIDNETVFTVGNKGFVNYDYTKEKKIGYIINYVPNGKEKGWKDQSTATDKGFNIATYLDANNEVIISALLQKKSALAKDMSFVIQSNAVADGKVLFENEFMSTKYDLQPMNGFIEDNGDISVMGIYFEKGAKEGKAKSLGMVRVQYSAAGKILNENYISWATDISKFLPSNAKGKIEDAGFIYFHNMIQTADGNYFAIGEEYKKVASAMGILSQMTGGGGSVIDMKIDDVNIFKFDKDFNLTDVQVFEKSKSQYGLPQGAGAYSGPLLAAYLKAMGAFDYSFTQQSIDKSSFTIGYVDFDKEGKKIKDRETVFGAVAYKDGAFTTDKISLNTESSSIRVYPAKPGFVLISEYFRKDKKLSLRLEKLDI